MDIERRQSDVLQQLGVSYPQLIDYTSKEYAAILVRFSRMTCRLFTQIDIDTNRPFGDDDLGLYYHFVCTLALPSKPECC